MGDAGIVGCDTLVALAPATRDGVTLFAKNSDRPPRECQRIVQLPRRRHPAGSRVRCQYLEIPQVEETAAVLGSQPWWLWGLEHGMNEHRVAIGNETVFTREPLGASGLLGMDLVRLGLERARTASEALDTVTRLIEAHGQGGSGHVEVQWPYHNGFLIADPREAWIVETSDRHWAARRVRETGNVSNGLALGTDWERGSADVARFAIEQGWWTPERGRLDFAAAYADDAGVPPNLCGARRRRAAALLGEARGRLTPGALRAILRDHYESGPVHSPRAVDDPHFFSLCMHADPLDNTTAAMVARLPADPVTPATTWVCLGSPCLGAFLPCWLEGTLPAPLSHGGAAPEPTSPWWRLRELLTLVERDPARSAPVVRTRWDAFEDAVARETAALEAEVREMAPPARAARLTGFMADTVAAFEKTAAALVREISAGAEPPGRARPFMCPRRRESSPRSSSARRAHPSRSPSPSPPPRRGGTTPWAARCSGRCGRAPPSRAPGRSGSCRRPRGSGRGRRRRPSARRPRPPAACG
jgi:secernin